VTILPSVLAASLLLAAPEAALRPPFPTAQDPVTGDTVTLDPTRGPMHLVFLATWCRPCLAELSKLADLEDRWKPDGYRLFLIAVTTRQTADRLREFRAQETLPGRLLYDADGSVAAALGASVLPTHLLIDKSGRVVARTNGLDPAFTKSVEKLMRDEGRANP
jgi:peroxiredoxin